MFSVPRGWASSDEDATIAASGTTSDIVSNVGSKAVGIILPATFTGTAMTYLVAQNRGDTFIALNNSSGAVSSTVAQNKAYKLPDDLIPFPYFKLVSGSTEGSARTIKVVRKS